MEIRYFFVTDNIRRNKLSVKYCPTEIMLGDYYTKPQQGSRMRRSRVSILNLKQDPTLVSQECVESRPGKSIHTAHPCRYSDACKKNTSLPDELVTRRATSYLMAAKGLLRKVKDKVNQLDSLYSINVK